MSNKKSVTAANTQILKISENISKAVELEANEILEDAENVVKEFIPARYVKRTLAAIEKKMDREGVEILFDKKVTREALKKTASEEVTDKELKELVDEVVNAIIEEFEDVLKDADEVADEEIEKVDGDKKEVEAKLKGVLERKLHAKGVYARFARNTTSKTTIAEKIRKARKQSKK